MTDSTAAAILEAMESALMGADGEGAEGGVTGVEEDVIAVGEEVEVEVGTADMLVDEADVATEFVDMGGVDDESRVAETPITSTPNACAEGVVEAAELLGVGIAGGVEVAVTDTTEAAEAALSCIIEVVPDAILVSVDVACEGLAIVGVGRTDEVDENVTEVDAPS